jgi:hypothetical protein
VPGLGALQVNLEEQGILLRTCSFRYSDSRPNLNEGLFAQEIRDAAVLEHIVDQDRQVVGQDFRENVIGQGDLVL